MVGTLQPGNLVVFEGTLGNGKVIKISDTGMPVTDVPSASSLLGTGSSLPTGSSIVTNQFFWLTAQDDVARAAPGLYTHDGTGWACHRCNTPYVCRCYANCLKLAGEYNIETIAFPSLGTGGHAIPIEIASPIAIQSVKENLKHAESVKKVYFVCYSNYDYDVYEKAFEEAID